ncbi:MAG: hypothetical protein WBC49_02360 [Thermoplasmata archaeon]
MSIHWVRVSVLLVATACLVSLSLVEPRLHADSGDIMLQPYDVTDGSSTVTVAEYELGSGETVKYSFTATDEVRYTVVMIALGAISSPRVTMLRITDASASGTFIADYDGKYRFMFSNPSEISVVELSYVVNHHLQWPTMLGVSLLLLAALTGGFAARYLIVLRRWQKTGSFHSPPQSGIREIKSPSEHKRKGSMHVFWFRR